MTTRMTIRCTGHAVDGEVKHPRIAFAVGGNASGWYLDGSTVPRSTAARVRGFRGAHADASALCTPGTQLQLERDVIRCSTCDDSVVVANPRRRAATFDSFYEQGQHTVTLAELRDRYREMTPNHPAVLARATLSETPDRLLAAP